MVPHGRVEEFCSIFWRKTNSTWPGRHRDCRRAQGRTAAGPAYPHRQIARRTASSLAAGRFAEFVDSIATIVSSKSRDSRLGHRQARLAGSQARGHRAGQGIGIIAERARLQADCAVAAHTNPRRRVRRRCSRLASGLCATCRPPG